MTLKATFFQTYTQNPSAQLSEHAAPLSLDLQMAARLTQLPQGLVQFHQHLKQRSARHHRVLRRHLYRSAEMRGEHAVSQLSCAGAADRQDPAAERRCLALWVEAHGVVDRDMVNLALGHIGIDLPTPGIDKNAQRLLAADPLSGLPVRIEVQPAASKRGLQVQAGDLIARGSRFLQLHIEPLARRGIFGQSRRVGQKASFTRRVEFINI